MKTPLIVSALSVTLIFAPGISLANSDDGRYPAANFQSQIIYQDKAVINTSSSSNPMGEKTTYDPKYPATSFEPKVLYQDEDALRSASSQSFKGEKSAYDPKYPAANFEPKVIYP